MGLKHLSLWVGTQEEAEYGIAELATYSKDNIPILHCITAF